MENAMIVRLWPFILGNVALGIDAYVIAGLLPDIADDLGSTSSVVGLGVTAFTGAYALAGPLLAGTAGRHAGRGLGIALLVFTLGNLLTAAVPGIAVYLIARVIAGAAAGVYSPLATAVAAASVPAESRGRALGLVLAGLATGTVFGVPLGLWLGQLTSWRVSILIIAAVGAASLTGIAVRTARGASLPDIDSPPAAARLWSLTRPAVQAYLSGDTATDVARRFGVTTASQIYTWVKAYRDHGPDGLAWRRRGRPKADTVPADEMTEVQKLAAEVEMLKAENAYLKALAALEAAEQDASQDADTDTDPPPRT
jgi:predicted MFS family arabinose efflux permease